MVNVAMITEQQFVYHYTTCNTRLVRRLSRMGFRTTEADIEDLASSTWLLAWRHRDQFNGDSSFFTWLCAIARNACIDRHRRVIARCEELHETFDEKEVPGTPPEADKQGSISEIEQKAKEIFSKVLPREYEVYSLRFIMGLSVEAISAQTGQNINTVKVKLFRTTARLRKKFQIV